MMKRGLKSHHDLPVSGIRFFNLEIDSFSGYFKCQNISYMCISGQGYDFSYRLIEICFNCTKTDKIC